MHLVYIVLQHVFLLPHFRAPTEGSGTIMHFSQLRNWQKGINAGWNMCKPTKSETKVGEEETSARATCENLWEVVLAWEMQIAIAELSERTISMALIRQARFELISKWATLPPPPPPHSTPLQLLDVITD